MIIEDNPIINRLPKEVKDISKIFSYFKMYLFTKYPTDRMHQRNATILRKGRIMPNDVFIEIFPCSFLVKSPVYKGGELWSIVVPI